MNYYKLCTIDTLDFSWIAQKSHSSHTKLLREAIDATKKTETKCWMEKKKTNATPSARLRCLPNTKLYAACIFLYTLSLLLIKYHTHTHADTGAKCIEAEWACGYVCKWRLEYNVHGKRTDIWNVEREKAKQFLCLENTIKSTYTRVQYLPWQCIDKSDIQWTNVQCCSIYLF